MSLSEVVLPEPLRPSRMSVSPREIVRFEAGQQRAAVRQAIADVAQIDGADPRLEPRRSSRHAWGLPGRDLGYQETSD